MTDKTVCIIIPTLNEEAHIGELLDSISANTYQSREIIVIDDGSTDKTVSIAKEKNATVLINKPGHRGPAYGWNRGAKYSEADIICTLGADFVLEDKHFLEKCVNAFDEDVAAVYTPYRTIQDTLVEKIVTKREGMGFEPRFVRRDVFLKIGGFPEIGVGEDVIFTKKLKEYVKKNNLKEKVVTDTFFSGHGVHTLWEMYRQAVWYGKTGILFLRELKEKKLLHAAKFYSRMIYFLAFISLFLTFFSSFFLLPSLFFFAVLIYLILGSFRNKYNLGKSVLFLIYGWGMLYGLLSYFLKINTKRGY
jgi:glycosyltransferase involved in cell wall biosynthesis